MGIEKKTTTTYINPVLVYATSVLFFLSTFWSVTLSNIEQHPLSVTLKNYQLALLVGKNKENPKMLIIFVCFFFNLFRERKLIKVVFSMFPLFLFLPGSCESGGERKLYFHCFFYYTLLTEG